MKIAIPVWEGKVSPVFDTASRLLVFQVEDKKETSRFETYLNEQDLAKRRVRIQDLGVDTLICGAISRHFRRMIMASGINVISWISGSLEDVLDAYLNGNLFHSKFLMPGCEWENGSTKRTVS
ncbi:MAG: NifB/NifX family molybdenum-iron cluster-binding protein [Thermodesulfobacteriota bacterium]|nr:NifB/NifX family molybdenum-iron cluster-binding protein [Thermodesulfobacteriota bacterium]